MKCGKIKNTFCITVKPACGTGAVSEMGGLLEAGRTGFAGLLCHLLAL